MKSHVSLEQHLCEVCGAPFDTGAVLLHRLLAPVLESKTVTAVGGKCGPCGKLQSAGFVALVAAKGTHGATVRHEDADRTGEVVHIKREAFLRIFNAPLPPRMMAYCEPEVVAKLKAMAEEAEA